jgi:hypothetical protein
MRFQRFVLLITLLYVTHVGNLSSRNGFQLIEWLGRLPRGRLPAGLSCRWVGKVDSSADGISSCDPSRRKWRRRWRRNWGLLHRLALIQSRKVACRLSQSDIYHEDATTDTREISSSAFISPGNGIPVSRATNIPPPPCCPSVTPRKRAPPCFFV